MKLFLTVVFTLFLFTTFFAQDLSREQKSQQIRELNAQINRLAGELLLPETVDIRDADSRSLKAFRLLPREAYDRPISVPQGGGSFYSFTTGSHDYQATAQINLELNRLSTGFAGSNFGLMADIGDVSITDDLSGIPELSFLSKYNAPTNIVAARAEQAKSRDYKVDNFRLKSYLPAVVGHSYILRAISFHGGSADVLVALKVIRKDTDGSLIIYWRQLADFGKPTLDPTIKER